MGFDQDGVITIDELEEAFEKVTLNFNLNCFHNPLVYLILMQNWGRYTYDVNTYDIAQFSRPPITLVQSSYVQNSSTPLTFDVHFQRNSPLTLLQMITNQLKVNVILGWLLYVITSFLQVGFRFQYQLNNLVWFSVDFFPFSWSQSCPQSNFKKLKFSFSPSSYSQKTRYGQGWAKASVSTFSWL